MLTAYLHTPILRITLEYIPLPYPPLVFIKAKVSGLLGSNLLNFFVSFCLAGISAHNIRISTFFADIILGDSLKLQFFLLLTYRDSFSEDSEIGAFLSLTGVGKMMKTRRIAHKYPIKIFLHLVHYD